MAVGLKETVLVPTFSRILFVLIVAVCAVIEVSLIGFGRAEPLLRYGAAPPLAAVLAFLVFWRPRVRIGPAEVEVVNPFRTHLITWPAVRDIDTKWTLTLVTVRGRIQVWAAPSPGPFGSIGTLRRDPRGGLVRDARTPSTPTAIGDVAAMLVLRQWQDYRDRGLLGAVEGEGMTTRLATPWVIVGSVLLVLTVVGIAWP